MSQPCSAQALTPAADEELIQACAKERRALVTLDLDFANPLVFPPERYAGIAVLRLPSKPSYASLLAVVRTFLQALEREQLSGKLWSVEGGRIRIYQGGAGDD